MHATIREDFAIGRPDGFRQLDACVLGLFPVGSAEHAPTDLARDVSPLPGLPRLEFSRAPLSLVVVLCR